MTQHRTLDGFLQDASMTAHDLAKELHVSGSYLSLIRSGKRTPTLQLAQRIAQRCKIPLESLIPQHGNSSNGSTARVATVPPADLIEYLMWRLEFLEREVTHLRDDLAQLRHQVPPTNAIGRNGR